MATNRRLFFPSEFMAQERQMTLSTYTASNKDGLCVGEAYCYILFLVASMGYSAWSLRFDF
jgi:hypothetical protein